MKHLFAAAAALAVGMVASHAQAGVVNDWNLIVTGNWNNASQDVEGNAFCGGNLTGGAPIIGTRLTPAQWVGRDSLVVVGNTTVSNVNIQAGNFGRVGSLSGNVNHNGGGSTRVDPSLAATAVSIAAELASLSNTLRALPADSIAQTPSGQPAPVRYNATPGVDGIAVFHVSANAVFNSSLIQQIELNLNGAAEVVINVSGATVNFNNGNMVGEWTSAFARANVIWNFFEATSINLDRNFNGALLAPLAHLTNSTAIDGSVFVRSFDQRGEVHIPFYNGQVPAPGALALLGVSALAFRRRRSA